jgi:chorismate lyase / 3-hydroxybenzoate synthase
MTQGGAELIFTPDCKSAEVQTSASKVELRVPMPLAAGAPHEVVFRGTSVVKGDVFHVVEGAGFIAGAAVAPDDFSPRESAAFLYDAMFRVIGDRPLCRVWNYIPRINAIENGEENYREFNAGRLESFRRQYGREFRPRLPAASALGTQSGGMALAFLAGSEIPQHFENPEQVPACDYPLDYGPQPPAFARGTRIESTNRVRWFLAGTASIKGHTTVGADCAEQMRLTLDNIRLMERAMSLPADAARAWKVFVRNAGDIAECRSIFSAAYPTFSETTMFLQADICRSSLLVEIEGDFSKG